MKNPNAFLSLAGSTRKEIMPTTPFREDIDPFFMDACEFRLPERKDRPKCWSDLAEDWPLQTWSHEESLVQRLRQAALALSDSIEMNAKKLGGVPLLAGTRFSVTQMLSQIADGDSIDDLAENFDLDRDQLSTILHAMAAYLGRSFYR